MEALHAQHFLVMARTTMADLMIFLTSDRDAAYVEAGKITNATSNRFAKRLRQPSGILQLIKVVEFEDGRRKSSDIVLIRDLIRPLHQDKPGKAEGRAE